MGFQKIVRRQYTVGFPGQIVIGGPSRGTVGRILSDGGPTAPNRIGRVFGFSKDVGVVGSGTSLTEAALTQGVVVGGTNFVGILAHPEHYALNGTQAGGSLAPTIDLPKGTEAELLNMVTGLVVEIYNHTNAAIENIYGMSLGYITTETDSNDNPFGLQPGTIVALDRREPPPPSIMPLMTGRVVNNVSLPASAVGAIAGALTIVSL